MINEDVRSLLISYLRQNRLGNAAEMLADLHPADIAELLDAFTPEEKRTLFRQLTTDQASEVLAELSEISKDQILSDLSHEHLGEILLELDSDDAADLLAGMDEDVGEQALASVHPEAAGVILKLLEYDEETAGGIMQTELLAVPLDETIAGTMQRVRRSGNDLDRLYNIFVVDDQNRVRGKLSLQQLILSEPGESVAHVMDADANSIPADMDQEEVARLFQKYDILSAPVVDENGNLLGRITIDDVVDIIEEEVSEDVLRMGGTHENELVYGDRIWKISGLRLPWLLTTLLGGLFTGYILWLFKVTLSDAIVLVTFVPVIMALGGSAAIQSTAITVRGMATRDIDTQRLGRVIFKEVRVGLIMALVCGTIIGLAAEIWHQNLALGLTVGCSLAAVVVVASLMGTLIPLAFGRLGIDPAISSGPFVTVANDITGLLIYLSIAAVSYHP